MTSPHPALGAWISAISTDFEDSIYERLSTQGLALVRDAHDIDKLDETLDKMGKPWQDTGGHCDTKGYTDTWTRIEPTGSSKDLNPHGIAFSRASLPLHTDLSSVPSPPDLMALICVLPGIHGASLLADGYSAIGALRRPSIRLLSSPDAAQFLNISEPFIKRLGSDIRLRYRSDKHFQINPRCLSAYDELSFELSRRLVKIRLQPGEGFIAHNHRWVHGRQRFYGSRSFFRRRLTSTPKGLIL